ncbi:MAG TPA: helix-hairpin-helix domain-containing protein, partial [Actinomycetes bacterium]|nr:helix-hairpin-helix domain-containing protein [Actinomycetes bacterium]
EADIQASERVERPAPAQQQQAQAPRSELDELSAGRHALPDPPRPVWRVDAAAVRGLLSLALAAAAGALVMVIVGWPRGTEAAAPPPDQRENVLLDAEPSASATAGVVVVDVDGRVKRPGVVELAAGSRVIDAIREAGGVAARGDTAALNLAEVLIDGQQVVVPGKGEATTSSGVPSGTSTEPPATSPTTTPSTVSINSASATELETLPGIGPVLAAAIVDWRTQNGGFTSIEQLQDVSGIGPATYAEIAPFVRL